MSRDSMARGANLWCGLAAAALCCMLVPMTGAAQQGGGAKPTDVKSLEAQIERTRKQRLELEARAEQELAAEIAERARRLAMGGEVGALQKLESLLDSAQTRLFVQRDRIRLLRDASQQTEQTVLVVLVRADALPAGEVAAIVMVDGVNAKSVTYKADEAKPLLAGAADELYRAPMTPTPHTVLLQLAAKGVSYSATVTVPVAAKQVSYVEFVLKGGRLTATTSTSKTTTF